MGRCGELASPHSEGVKADLRDRSRVNWFSIDWKVSRQLTATIPRQPTGEGSEL